MVLDREDGDEWQRDSILYIQLYVYIDIDMYVCMCVTKWENVEIEILKKVERRNLYMELVNQRQL